MKIDAFNFTIYDVENIQTDLMVEFDNNENLDIDMSSVEKIDMAAMQLLVSAKRSCQAENKTFSLSHVSDEVVTAIRVSGLEAELGV